MRIFNLLLATLFLLLSSCASGQKKGKKSTQEAPFSDDLSKTLTKYVQEGDKNSTMIDHAPKSELSITDDTKGVDSVTKVLQTYYSNKTKAKGWRIQIWDGTNHLDMDIRKKVYLENFSSFQLAIHDDYDKTMFRLRVGDFTNHLEAYRYFQKIKKQFPSALLVPDEVDLSTN